MDGSDDGSSLGISLGLLDKEGSMLSLGAALGMFMHWPAPSQIPSGVSGVKEFVSTKQSTPSPAFLLLVGSNLQACGVVIVAPLHSEGSPMTSMLQLPLREPTETSVQVPAQRPLQALSPLHEDNTLPNALASPKYPHELARTQESVIKSGTAVAL